MGYFILPSNKDNINLAKAIKANINLFLQHRDCLEDYLYLIEEITLPMLDDIINSSREKQ